MSAETARKELARLEGLMKGSYGTLADVTEAERSDILGRGASGVAPRDSDGDDLELRTWRTDAGSATIDALTAQLSELEWRL